MNMTYYWKYKERFRIFDSNTRRMHMSNNYESCKYDVIQDTLNI